MIKNRKFNIERLLFGIYCIISILAVLFKIKWAIVIITLFSSYLMGLIIIYSIYRVGEKCFNWIWEKQ